MLEGVAHGAGGLPTLCRILCKGAVDDVADRLRNVWRTLSQRNGRLVKDGAYCVVDTAVLTQIECEGAGQQTVRCHTHRIDIGLRLYIAKVAQLFGRHVRQGTGHLAGHRHTTHARVSKTLRETKVRQLCQKVWRVT